MGMSEQDARKNRDFNALGGSAVAEFAADVFLCPFETCHIRSVSDPSYANVMLVTGQKLVAENGVVNGLYSGYGPMLFKQMSYTVAKFNVQQKVAETIYQNLGTSPSEMSKGAVLTVSLVSGIAAGLAAPTATIPHTTDGILSEVNKKGAAGEGSMMVQLGRIAGACDCLNFVTAILLSKFVCPDSEICFESNLNEGLISLGFCETQNQILFRYVSCVASTRLHHLGSGFGCTPVLCCLTQDLKVSQEGFQCEWRSQTAHQSIKLYEFDHCIFTYSNEFAGKIIVEPEGENDKNMIIIYVRTSSEKTISIKCDKKRKAVTILDEVETYLVHHGKVLNEKRTIEENNIGTETTIDMSLRLLGRTDKSESMDTLDKKRKLDEVSEGKLTRPSAVFLRREIIDALKRSDENMASYSRKTDEKMEQFLQQFSDTVGAQLHGMNSAIVKMKEEEDGRYEQINECFTEREKILDIDKNTKARVKKAKERMLTGIRVRQ